MKLCIIAPIGAVVAAGAVVTHDVPEYSVVGGGFKKWHFSEGEGNE